MIAEKERLIELGFVQDPYDEDVFFYQFDSIVFSLDLDSKEMTLDIIKGRILFLGKFKGLDDLENRITGLKMFLGYEK